MRTNPVLLRARTRSSVVEIVFQCEGHFHHLSLWQTNIKNISEDLLEHILWKPMKKIEMTCKNKLLPFLAILAVLLEGWLCHFGADWNMKMKILYRHSQPPNNISLCLSWFPDFSYSTKRSTFVDLCMYQQLLGGFPGHFLHTLMSLSASGVSRLFWLGWSKWGTDLCRDGMKYVRMFTLVGIGLIYHFSYLV